MVQEILERYRFQTDYQIEFDINDMIKFGIEMYNEGVEDSVNNAEAYTEFDDDGFGMDALVRYESITDLKIK